MASDVGEATRYYKFQASNGDYVAYLESVVSGTSATFTAAASTRTGTARAANTNVAAISPASKTSTVQLYAEVQGQSATRPSLILAQDTSGTGTLEINNTDVNIDTGKTYNINGSPHTHAYVPETGWIAITATWTRTGNHTFTVSGDVTATYRKGTKVRYKDGGSYEYGVVASSSYGAPNTTVTLITNTDYAMAAATITDTYISYIDNPEGFPQWFNFTTTPTRSGTAYTNAPTINSAKWKAESKLCFFAIQSEMHATTVGGTGYQIYSAPVTVAARATGTGMNLNSAYGMVVFVETTGAGEIRLFKYDGTQEALAANYYFFNGSYEY